MNVSISLHWTPPLHFHGWERGRPCLQSQEAFRQKGNRFPTAVQLWGFSLHRFFGKMLLGVLKAENSGWELTGETNHRAVLMAVGQKVFSAPAKAVGLFLPRRTGSQRAWHQGSCRTSWTNAWMTVCSASVGVRRKKVGWTTQMDAPSAFTHVLSASSDYFIASEQLAPLKEWAALSGSGQSWLWSEYIFVICCWGFDPDCLHQIWNKTCVFASIAVCRGAGVLRGGTWATSAFRDADECKAIFCQYRMWRNVWWMWPAQVQHSISGRFLEAAIKNAIFI